MVRCQPVFATVHTENRTRKVSVPFLTVVVQLQPGEELILQVEPKPKHRVKRVWRDLAREENKNENNMQGISKKPKGKHSDDLD